MTWICENWKWPLVCSNPNNSASTWQKFKIKDSFEILRTSRFQNWPYFLDLVKILWRYCQKTNCQVFLWTPCIFFTNVLSIYLWSQFLPKTVAVIVSLMITLSDMALSLEDKYRVNGGQMPGTEACSWMEDIVLPSLLTTIVSIIIPTGTSRWKPRD